MGELIAAAGDRIFAIGIEGVVGFGGGSGGGRRFCSVGNFSETVILFGPVLVVDVVVVISGRGDTDFEEVVIGGKEHRGGGHEASAGVAVDAHAVGIDPGELSGELLDAGFFVSKAVIAEVEVAEGVVGF